MAQHSVNVTILVLAHKNLLQLSRLIRHLQSDFDVFVHLDDRSNMQVSDFSEFNRTRVIKKFRTTWGSLGIVRATLELFTLASSGGRYDRFVLISGQDVPLKTNKELIEFFELHRNVDFVQTEALTGKNESRLRRVDSFHFFPKSVRSWVWHQNGPFSYFLTQTITNLGKYLDGLIARIGFRRPLDYSFRWGAQWMDLRSETLERVLDFVHTNSHFLERFRFTHAPDEFFFQTAIESCQARQISAIGPRRFIDWNSGPEHPRILRIDDLARIRESDMLFARKCDISVDEELVDCLYAQLETNGK